MKKLDWRIERKKEILLKYRQALRAVESVKFFEQDLINTTPWFIDILCERRADLQEHLKKRGIGTRVMYPPINKQQAYQRVGHHPVSELVGRQGLWLPSSSQLTDQQIETVCDCRRGILQLTFFMPRVIFLNRFFYPDHSATSRMVSDLAFELASSGKDVHVITSRQLYDKPGADLPAYEIAHGVHIHRVGTTSFGRSRLPGRAMDYLSFYFTSWRCALSIARPGDIIVAKTDPPMISLIGMAAAKQRGAKLVNWVQDVYPEIAIEFGVPFLIAPVRRLLFWLRDMSLKAATANVVLGQLPARLVLSRGVPSDRVTIIHNWSDEDEIVPIAHADNTLRQAWGLSDKFVVGYSGNLGRTHEFLTMLSVSERFRNDRSYRISRYRRRASERRSRPRGKVAWP